MYNIGVLNERTFPVNGLTSYWRLNVTGSTIYDSVANISATVGNTALFTTDGKNGNGWKTNLTQGTNATDAIYSSTSLSVTNGASISWWMKKASNFDSTKFQYIVGIRSWNTSKINGFMGNCYGSSGGVLYIQTQIGNNFAGGPESRYTFSYTGLYSGTDWYHYVITLNGTDITSQKLYQNGVLITGGTTSGTATSIVYDKTYFTLGRFVNTVFNSGNHIDECATWNRPLTQDEVTAIYNLGTGIYY